MRRFELVEGKSAKFWEVSQEGSDLHLRWGRLGTGGQSQTKSFASDAAAEKEAEKLIKEKTKKGYTEVEAGEASPAPAPKKAAPASTKAPEEAPAAEPAKPEPVEEAKPVAVAASNAPSAASATPVAPIERRLRAHELRSHLLTWSTTPDRAAAFAALQTSMRASTTELRRRIQRVSGVDHSLISSALDLLEAKEPPALDFDGAAKLIALAGWNAHAYLAACFSPSELVRLVVLADGYVHTQQYQGNDYYPVLHQSTGSLAERIDFACAAAWIADRLEGTERAALEAEVEAAWSGWMIDRRARAAFVLGRDDRWAERVLESLNTYPQTIFHLVASCTSAEQVKRLMTSMDRSWLYASWPVLALLVDRRGLDAGPILVELGERLSELRVIADVMKSIESPEIARFMGDLLEHRELKGAARAYLESTPAMAIATLATSKKQMARSTVEALVRANAASLDAWLPMFAPAERAAVEQIRAAATVNVPEASPEELPAVLVSPPWTRPRKKVGKPVTLALTTLDMPERIEWREGQKAQWLAAPAWGQPTVQGNERLVAAVEQWAVKGGDSSVPSYQRGVSTSMFMQADDDVALACWNKMTPEAFGWTYADSVRRLVTRFEERGIPGYVAFGGKNMATAAELFARIRSPRMAPFYARVLASRGKARAYAQAWMDSFPEEAAAGLVPEALGDDKKARAIAEDAIAYLGQKGHRDAVLKIAERYGAETLAPVRELLERDPLDQVPAKLPKIPEWANVEALPRPLLAGRTKALSKEATEHLITMLAFSPLDPPYPGIEQVKEACDPVSLVDFAWGLCSTWLGADGSSAGDFAMLSLAHLAGDEGARRLTPLIRKWPGEAAHARAVKGLDVLAAIGTDVALMHLHGIAQKLKFKGLQAKAQEKITQIAEARELTTEELADRLVPDLELDENGTMILDFGPRQFTVGFDEQLTPFVLEGTTRKKDLPKPGKADDAEKAKEATEMWKTLKKDVRAIATNQLERLEQLMCSERRVALDVFQRFFVEHPLLVHLVRRLVWGAYENGALTQAFRVNEERRFTNADDDPIELADTIEIGLLHPLAMDEATRARFGELFADYELLQPFEQLGRATFTATKEELEAKALKRFEGAKAPLGSVRGLESRGWVRGMPQDAGLVWDVIKPIPGHPDLEVMVALDPGFSAAGYNDFADTATQKLGAPTVRKKSAWRGSEPLDVLGAIQMSELIRDLTLITS
jgi:predicted DNA-binding WGR domain protein